MSTMQSEVYEALRAIDIPEEKAVKAAAALSHRDEDVASLRADTSLIQANVRELQTDVRELKTDVRELQTDVRELKASVREIRSDVDTLKRDNAVMKWMMGFVLAFQAGIFVKLFIH